MYMSAGDVHSLNGGQRVKAAADAEGGSWYADARPKYEL